MIIIYGIDTNLNPIKSKLSDVIHQTMQEILGLPESKRAHRFVPLPKENFFYPEGRTDAYTVLEINLMEGRTVATKKALIKALFQNIQTQLNIDPVNIEITIHEQPPHCWGFRGITGDEANLNYDVNR